MGITMIALAGILLLGAGIAILVVNLGRNRGSNMTIEQIGTYGYVAESAGGSEVEPARRPIDALAGRLGDFAAKRTSRSGEAALTTGEKGELLFTSTTCVKYSPQQWSSP